MACDPGLFVFLATALAMPLMSATLIAVKAYQDRKAKTAVTRVVQRSAKDHPLQRQDSEPDVCAICLSALVDPDIQAGRGREPWPAIMAAWPTQPVVTLKKCRHTFHGPCIISWVSRGNERCPMCRQRCRF